jgi:hypothetical protein
MVHAPALTAVVAPTVNGYGRLSVGDFLTVVTSDRQALRGDASPASSTTSLGFPRPRSVSRFAVCGRRRPLATHWPQRGASSIDTGLTHQRWLIYKLVDGAPGRRGRAQALLMLFSIWGCLRPRWRTYRDFWTSTYLAIES